jgi:AAA-like domain
VPTSVHNFRWYILMNSESEFPWLKLKESADKVIFKNTGKYLSDIEIIVIQASWEGKTYDEMAKACGYSAEYLNKDVGNKLWHKLSESLGETVTKRNFKEALKRASDKQNSILLATNLLPPYPEGAIAADSPFYIQRFGVESLCEETIIKPGSLIRIKAPKLMGKTSLINRLLAHAVKQNHQTVYLDLNSVERTILNNLDKFLRWLSLMVGRQLKLENNLNDYWDTEILGSNDNCTAYFEEYLLPAIDKPCVLVLDNLERVFSCPQVIEDFFGMLRSWHEKGKMSHIWKQLRLVIAHSTEVYVALDINQSPFNAGIPVELLEFDKEQIQDLAHLHGLNWNSIQVTELIEIVGGHPYLVRLAMYEVSYQNARLEKLLQEAATEAGIYSNHLRRHLEILQKTPELAIALKKVVASSEPIELDSMHIYKLHSMGLVRRQNNYVLPRCNVYRDYFYRVLNS